MNDRRLTRARLHSRLTAVLLVGLLGCIGARAETPLSTLRILGRTPLPPGHSMAMDLRWAGDDSVYVTRAIDGVFEMGLDGARRKVMVPGFKAVASASCCDRLAVSDKALAVATRIWTLSWRPRRAEPDRSFLLEQAGAVTTEDMDLQGDRVLLLGIQNLDVFKRDGAVAWLGSLGSKLEDMKPVLYDKAGAGAPNYYACRHHGLGAARFLPDGSFVIAPGFESGVRLFNAEGRQVRSWTGREIGVDTDCSGMSEQDEKDFRLKHEVWHRWLNRHRSVDDILPLPEGPSLLVRSLGEDGRVHWELKVLSGERVTTYVVPIEGARPTDQLHGDVRGDRIALLLSASAFSGKPVDSDPQGEVILLRVPQPR